MAPLHYLRVVSPHLGEMGRGMRAGNREFQQSDPCAQLIIRSWMARKKEVGRRNVLDSICPHLRYNGLINDRGNLSVFGVVPVSFTLDRQGMESHFLPSKEK